jgi:RNA polymerase sigma-70 factor (ECF subfamily)
VSAVAATQALFERLVAEHERDVLRISRSMLRDEHLGADAAQETFIRLWRALDEGRAPERSGAWLRRVAITTALDLLRRRAARAEEPAVSEPLDERGPGEALAAGELEQRFERAVATLPEGQRTIFLLRHSAQLSLSEVADSLGLALPTVKTQFARACLKLQQALRPFGPGPDSRRP